MKKVLAIALVCILAAGFMAGCDKKTVSTKKVDLLIGNPDGDALTPKAIFDNFKAEHPEYNITTDEASWGDFTQKVKLQFVSKSDVTSVFITDSASAMSFGAQGALENLKARTDKDLDASLYNKALYSVTDKEGNLWGVPHAMNSIAIIYNQDIFDKYGVPYPEEDWTWEEMLGIAEKLTVDENGDGETDIYGILYTTNITQGWLPFMAAVGAEPFGPDLDRSNLLDPKVKEAFTYYSRAYANGWIPDDAWISTNGSRELAFAAGKIAMYVCQSSGLNAINNNAPEGFRYDAQIMPIGWNGERTCIYVPNVWVMYSGSSDEVKDAAWEWIKYYMSEESQNIVADQGKAGYPVMKSALQRVTANGLKPEHKDAFYRGIDDYGMTILESPVSEPLNKHMQTVAWEIKADPNIDMDSLLKQYNELVQEEFDFYFQSKK